MATYQGIIAGIGDKETNTNVIVPQFDAAIRNFIMGKNCILDGFALIGDTLTAGSCIAEGYVGYIEEPIKFDKVPEKVYGIFSVNHSNKLDEFHIATGNNIEKTVSFTMKDGGTTSYPIFGLVKINCKKDDIIEHEVRLSNGLSFYENHTATQDKPYTVNFTVSESDGVTTVSANFSAPITERISKIELIVKYSVGERQDDILHEAGEYWFQIYPEKEELLATLTLFKDYPLEEKDYVYYYAYGGWYYTYSGDEAISIPEGARVEYTITGSNIDAGKSFMTMTESGTYSIGAAIIDQTKSSTLTVELKFIGVPPKYPRKSENSDYTNHIYDGGNLGVNVTCPTQSANDNSKKVANTKFVHDVIKKEIGYDTKDIKISAQGAIGFNLTGTLHLEKKADYVIATYEIPTGEYADSDDTIEQFTVNIPQEYRPVDDSAYITFVYKVRLGSPSNINGDYIVAGNVLSNGNFGMTFQSRLQANTVSQYHVSGWKIK